MFEMFYILYTLSGILKESFKTLGLKLLNATLSRSCKLLYKLCNLRRFERLFVFLINILHF